MLEVGVFLGHACITLGRHPLPGSLANGHGSTLYLTKGRFGPCSIGAALLLCSVAIAPVGLYSQVITMDTRTGTQVHGKGAPVDRRFAQVEPTKVPLSRVSLNTKTKLELLRIMQSEQGFAMRPIPRGHKGLVLEANGFLKPAGESYVTMVTVAGLCAKPGDRVVITDMKVDRNHIVFQLNGGPDFKHRFLRHLEIGSGPMMTPVAADTNDPEPMGARLTLEFKAGVPELTGAELKALLAPLISFDVKTPIQAFTDTLPPMLKNAILNHDVLVGMTTDMVFFAKGQPDKRMREMDGQMPFEEWIYGKPPKDVEFVRINGNRVIRVEIAKIGKPVQVFERDVVEGMMRTDGTPLTPGDPPGVRTVQLGDVHRDPDRQAAAAPPSLRKTGETAPDTQPLDQGTYSMKPVRFPSQRPDDQPGYEAPAGQPSAQPATQKPGSVPVAQPAQGTGDSKQPAQSPIAPASSDAPATSAAPQPQ